MSKEIALQHLLKQMETGSMVRKAVLELARHKKAGEWNRHVFLPIEKFMNVVLDSTSAH